MTTFRDIKLDVNGDLDMSGQDLQLVGDMDAIIQSVQIRLRFFKEEWFADESVGIPYFQQVLVKNPNVNVLTSIFRDEIRNTLGIIAVTAISLSFDSAARTLGVTFSATTDFGELVNLTVSTQ